MRRLLRSFERNRWCCSLCTSSSRSERLTASAEEIGVIPAAELRAKSPGKSRDVCDSPIKSCRELDRAKSIIVRDNRSNRRTASAMSAQGPSCVVIAFFHRRRRRSSMHSTSPGHSALRKSIERMHIGHGDKSCSFVSGRDRPRDRPR